MSTQKKTILYLMHVDWNWIKQRPHFLAEELSKRFNIVVICKSARCKTNMVDNKTGTFECLSLPNIPLQRFKLMRRLNRLLSKWTMRSVMGRVNPDYLWITHPALVDFVPKNPNCKVIYDCMDDALGFKPTRDIDPAKMLEFEKRLIRISDHVFCSSARLAKLIAGREPCEGKLTLARNAFGGDILDAEEQAPVERGYVRFRVGYCGTVAEWFDFEALEYCLERIPELEFDIVGPLQNASPIAHERLKLLGPMDHTKLQRFAKTCDCLIMPFKLTELILSVDPVKFYEYINFYKPIISVEYDEVRRFEPFVSFYSGKEQLLAVIREVMSNPAPKYSSEQRILFLRENSWEQRAAVIANVLGVDAACGA